MFEQPTSLEGNLRKQLVDAIIKMRERGVEDSEARRLLNEWIERTEKDVPTNQPNRNKGAILLNAERARLYRDAGFIEETLENYQDALMQLGNENDRKFATDTAEIIYAEIDALPQS